MTAASRQADNIPQGLLAAVDEAVTHYPVSQRSASLPLLHLWQNHFGWIDGSGVDWIARRLGLEPINILELVTFYPWFRQTPPGKKIIRVCRTLSCAMAGSYELHKNLCRAAGCDTGHDDHAHEVTAPDGSCTIEFVECLASCGSAPVAMVDDDLHERIAPTEAAALLGRETGYGKTIRAAHPAERRLVLRHVGREDYDTSIECYLRHGGYETLKKALAMKPDEIVNEVKASGLRGRGGVGPGLPCSRARP